MGGSDLVREAAKKMAVETLERWKKRFKKKLFFPLWPGH